MGRDGVKVRVDGGAAAEPGAFRIGDEVLGRVVEWAMVGVMGSQTSCWVWPTKGHGDLGETVSVAEWA